MGRFPVSARGMAGQDGTRGGFFPLLQRLRTPRAAAVAALVVAFPTIFSGFLLDDHIHLLTLDGDGYGASPFDLFLFGSGDPAKMDELIATGPYPWYTLPALKIHFFRPLSSALMALDRVLFGEGAIFYHLHSLLWYALLAWGAALVFRRALPMNVAAIAILLYVLDETHLVPVLWWSNRNALVAGAPALLGLAAHLKWRKDGWGPGLPLSVLGYGLGLLGGEGALGILGYVVAYEAFGRSGRPTGRMGATLPGLALAAVYLAVYKGLGHGVGGSGVYLDPLGEWRVFMASAPARLVELAAIQFFGVPAEFAVVSNTIGTLIRVLSIGCVAWLLLILGQLWRVLPPDTRRTAAWLGAGALIAAVPCLATFPSGRLLIIPSVGACALMALVIAHGWRCARGFRTAFLQGGARVFVLLNIVLAPVVWVGVSAAIPVFTHLSRDAFRVEELREKAVEDVLVFCLYAADPYTGLYPPALWRRMGLAEPAGWQCFSVAPFAHKITRTGENSFEISVVEGELLSTPFERLMRGPQFPFVPGERLDFGEYTVLILETGAWGPSRFEVTLSQALESPRYCFLAWESGELNPFNWPAVGESTVLAPGDGYFAWRHFKKRLPLL